jgi:hypothetical protein
METTIGPLGFSIPLQNLSAGTEVDFTPTKVSDWCQSLPLADLGTVTKKLFHALSECNQITLSPSDRFEILALFSQPLLLVCGSLNKHFIHQTKKLSKQQLIIANLAQTFHTEINNGYKLIIEQSVHDTSEDVQSRILPIALQRFLYHSSQIILQNYQLYTNAPENMWKELHLSYQISEKTQSQRNEQFNTEYKRILLLTITSPYHWNQIEQAAIYKASQTWAAVVTLQKESTQDLETGVFFIDLTLDKPPILFNRTEIKLSAACAFLDVNPVLPRLESLLNTLEPNELRAKLAHYHEPEYAVSVPILKGLIKTWKTVPARLHKREKRSVALHICIGLIAAHYYLNGKQLFQQPQSSEENANPDSALPTLTVEEDIIEEKVEGNTKADRALSEQESFGVYPVYRCNLFDENSQGYGLLWPENVYPPIQAGALIGILRSEENESRWEVGRIRWLQHSTANEFKLGVERLAGIIKAGAVQLAGEGETTIYLRGLLLESTLLVPILPFRTGDRVSFIQENEPPIDLDLTDLVDSTGSYKQFSFTTKRSTAEKLAALKAAEKQTKIVEIEKKNKIDREAESDGFDSVWTQL